MGGSNWNTDAVVGYSTTLFKKRIRWNLSLNVRNVLNDDTLIAQNGLSAASTPDALSSIRTAVEYRFNAALGVSYRIEACTDLVNWTAIETPIIGAGGVITRFYSTEGQPKRFFRSRRN